MKARHALQVLSLAAVLAACGAEAKRGERVAGCPSTRPDEVGQDVAGIQIILPGSGKLVALPRSAKPPPGDHLISHDIDADGTISIKFPVWTGPRADGPLRIRGTSVDGRPGRVRGEYRRDPRDFHPGYLVFPSEGCWRVTTRAGASRVTFVIDVVLYQKLQAGSGTSLSSEQSSSSEASSIPSSTPASWPLEKPAELPAL
jgi:hypothetical protein